MAIFNKNQSHKQPKQIAQGPPYEAYDVIPEKAVTLRTPSSLHPDWQTERRTFHINVRVQRGFARSHIDVCFQIVLYR